MVTASSCAFVVDRPRGRPVLLTSVHLQHCLLTAPPCSGLQNTTLGALRAPPWELLHQSCAHITPVLSPLALHSQQHCTPRASDGPSRNCVLCARFTVTVVLPAVAALQRTVPVGLSCCVRVPDFSNWMSVLLCEHLHGEQAVADWQQLAWSIATTTTTPWSLHDWAKDACMLLDFCVWGHPYCNTRCSLSCFYSHKV